MARRRWLALAGAVSFVTSYVVARLGPPYILARGAIERGREARTPLGMTWLGWKDALLRTWNSTDDNRLLSVAAGVAFFALLAVVPGLSVLISIFGLFSDPVTIVDQLAPFLRPAPLAVRELINEQAARLSAQPAETLSMSLILSFLIAGWSANAGVKGLFDALNVIYGEKEKRSLLHFHALSLLATITGALLFVVVLIVVAVLPGLFALLPFRAGVEFAVTTLRWPAFYIAAALAIALLYWIGPSRRAARFEWVLPGAFLAALAWVAASAAFGWYVGRLGNYTAMYGSLAAVIVFMTWLWLSAVIVLIGAALNAELEHQTARDTTYGPEKPLGTRGATMADAVGPAVAER